MFKQIIDKIGKRVSKKQQVFTKDETIKYAAFVSNYNNNSDDNLSYEYLFDLWLKNDMKTRL